MRDASLNALRSHLLKETPESASVTVLANEHGFSELGRLAGTYRRTFGELPSETLRRAYLSEV
nr:helix-turn-helix domain-containing protein [Falsiruegeria mediterranea]